MTNGTINKEYLSNLTLIQKEYYNELKLGVNRRPESEYVVCHLGFIPKSTGITFPQGFNRRLKSEYGVNPLALFEEYERMNRSYVFCVDDAIW